jgi:hypothetical protein
MYQSVQSLSIGSISDRLEVVELLGSATTDRGRQLTGIEISLQLAIGDPPFEVRRFSPSFLAIFDLETPC